MFPRKIRGAGTFHSKNNQWAAGVSDGTAGLEERLAGFCVPALSLQQPEGLAREARLAARAPPPVQFCLHDRASVLLCLFLISALPAFPLAGKSLKDPACPDLLADLPRSHTHQSSSPACVGLLSFPSSNPTYSLTLLLYRGWCLILSVFRS